MNPTRVTWLFGLLGLSITACAPEQDPAEREAWPGMDEGMDPADFTGRIDVELCDGADNDGDSEVDEGCTGDCDAFTTRTASFWQGATCVLDGDATGFTGYPVMVGSLESYDTAAQIATVLAVDPGSDPKLRLRRQIIVMKLNAAYFNLGSKEVVDWNTDGTMDDVDWLLAKADAYYDGTSTTYQILMAEQLREMNNLGTDMPLWFDESCADDPEFCDGIDNDGDGSTDEDCGCVEVCGDDFDNDGDGTTDEGCDACGEYQSRTESFWETATCVVDGDLGYEVLPITLGASETYSTAAAVETMLLATTGGAAQNRLRHQLMVAKLNRAAFNTGASPALDWGSNGTVETVDELIAIADTLFDGGLFWKQNSMTLALKTVNEAGSATPIYFSASCSGEAEFCDGVDNDGDGSVDEYCGCVEACDGYDNDGDGSIDETFPEGCPTEELCDGVDNDGDGDIDEADAVDATEWFADDDSDGHGNPGISQTACDQPTGYVADDIDCDDDDPTVYTGAEEICDNQDNDCDGSTDEVVLTTRYADDDGDGYGDPSTASSDCDTPDEYIEAAGDCDDTDEEINPDAIDWCDDGIDSDCSGDEVGCYEPGSPDDATFIGEAASDDAGVAAARVGDVNDDGIDDVVIGARNNDFSGTDAGAAYLFYGPVTYSGEVSLSNADLKLYGGAAGDKAGRTVIGGEDLDGDGVDDVTIGAPNEDTAGSSAGAAYVFFGSTLSAITDPAASVTEADVIYTGRNAFDYLASRTSYSELTGDSTVDLLLSNTGDSVGGATAGGIYIYAGPLTASETAISIASGTWAARITGETAGDQIGLYVGTGGDLDGDGSGDVIVGVPRQDGAGTDAGATYLVAGPLTGTVGLGSANAKITGSANGDKLGSAVTFAGDQNLDGYDDFFTTAPFEDTADSDAGAVYLVYGAATLSSLDGLAIGSVAAATIEGKERSGQIGSSAEADGDHDGDGVNDLITGANNDGPDAEGATYLFYGPISGSLSWSDADWSKLGDAAYDHAGSFVSYGGDLRGLGGDTIIIGAREADVGGTADAGKVYLIFQAD